MGRGVDLDLVGDVDLPVGDGFRHHGRPVRHRDVKALRGRETFRIAGGGGDRGRPGGHTRDRERVARDRHRGRGRSGRKRGVGQRIAVWVGEVGGEIHRHRTVHRDDLVRDRPERGGRPVLRPGGAVTGREGEEGEEGEERLANGDATAPGVPCPCHGRMYASSRIQTPRIRRPNLVACLPGSWPEA